MAKAINVVVSGNAAPLRKALGQAESNLGAFGASVRRFALPAAAALGGVAFAGFQMAQAAMEDQQAAAELARQLRATTKATDAQVASVEAFIEKTSLATGVADDDLRPALAALVRGTKDVTTAQRRMGLVLDVSAATGKNAVEVADALAKAYQGNYRGLRSLTPEMAAMIKEGASLEEVIATLEETFGGAAETAANTSAGEWKRVQVAFSEIKEQIGTALLPVMDRLATFVRTKIIPYAQKLADAFKEDGISGAIRTVIEDFGKFVQESEGWTGVIVDLTITVLALGTAIKGLLLINAVATAFGALATGITTLGSVFPALAGVTTGFIATAFGLIALNVFTLVGALKDPIFRSDIFRYIRNTAALAMNAVIGLANGVIFLGNMLIDLANLAIRGLNILNPFADIPKIPRAGYFDYVGYDFTPYGGTTGGPQSAASGPGGVRRMADGGIITRRTMLAPGIMGGEAGPEAIIPLDRLSNFAGGGNVFNITVHAGVGDPREIGRVVVDSISQYERTAGPVYARAS